MGLRTRSRFWRIGFCISPHLTLPSAHLLIPEKIYQNTIPLPEQTILRLYRRMSSVKGLKWRNSITCGWCGRAKEEIAAGRCAEDCRFKEGPGRNARYRLCRHFCPSLKTTRGFLLLVVSPGYRAWMGASPELLLRVTGRTFETMSLAGTMAYTGTQNPDWGEKERVEQELVTQYILETLGDKTASLVATTPRSVRAGGLLHLQSKINGLMGKTGLEDLLAALHPTPAICGLPRAAALEFIKRNEGYGPSNTQPERGAARAGESYCSFPGAVRVVEGSDGPGDRHRADPGRGAGGRRDRGRRTADPVHQHPLGADRPRRHAPGVTLVRNPLAAVIGTMKVVGKAFTTKVRPRTC